MLKFYGGYPEETAEKLVNGEEVIGITIDTTKRDEHGNYVDVPASLPEEVFKRDEKGEEKLSFKGIKRWLQQEEE